MTYNTHEEAMSVARFLAKNNYASSVQVLEQDGGFIVDYKDLSNDYPQYKRYWSTAHKVTALNCPMHVDFSGRVNPN